MAATVPSESSHNGSLKYPAIHFPARFSNTHIIINTLIVYLSLIHIYMVGIFALIVAYLTWILFHTQIKRTLDFQKRELEFVKEQLEICLLYTSLTA